MIADGAEKLFEVVVGLWQIRVIVALEERLPIARRDFEEDGVQAFTRGSVPGSMLAVSISRRICA
jgi:hypothetical protein